MTPSMIVAHLMTVAETDRNTNAWFSCLLPNRAQALFARPSASPMALPSFPPFGPLDDDVYVFRQINPCDERRTVGRETWKLQDRLGSEPLRDPLRGAAKNLPTC